MTSAPDEKEYILGTDSEETVRLREQHEAWAGRMRELCRRAGIGPGSAVLDLGCGPGFTTFELAGLVGDTGRVIGQDLSARFIDFLELERDRLGLGRVTAVLGPAESASVEPVSLDAVYARWLLCWLERPGLVFERVVEALRPGGALVLQEYLDWGAMKLIPRETAFDAAIEACMRAWPEGGATIDIGDEIPALAASHGLRLEHFEPAARLGVVGSPEWRWITGFLRVWLPKLVARDLWDAAGCTAALRVLDAREEAGTGYIYTPTMVDVILRKPAT